MSGRSGNHGRAGGGRHHGSRGRSPRPASHYVARHSPVGAQSNDASPAHESGFSKIGRGNLELAPVEGITKKFNDMLTSEHRHGPHSASTGVRNISPDVGRSESAQNNPVSEEQTPKPYLPTGLGQGYVTDFPSFSTQSGSSARSSQIVQSQVAKEINCSPSQFSRTSPVDVIHKKNTPSQVLGSGSQDGRVPLDVQIGKTASAKTCGDVEFENSDIQHFSVVSAYAMSGRSGNHGRSGGGRHYDSRGRSPRPASHYVARHSPVGAHSNDASPAHESGFSNIGRGKNSEIAPVEGVTKKFNDMLTSEHRHGPHSASTGVRNILPDVGRSKSAQNNPVSEEQTPKPYLPTYLDQGYVTDFPSFSTQSGSSARSSQIVQSQVAKEVNSSPLEFSLTSPVAVIHKENTPSQVLGSGSQDGRFPPEGQSGKTASEKTCGNVEFENSDIQHKGFSFDICEERNKKVVKLKSSLLVTNKAKRNETKRLMEGDNIKILRPGMVLLKGYLSLVDQVKLVKSCRNLGRGSGGFYQPGYNDGATLHLKMMCLGKNWDPQTSSYADERPVDGAKPPPIPDEFQRFVKGAIQECYDYLESHSKVKNAKDIIPSVSPNICIINFYSKTGKLGLHQDKDESQESLRKGLPVVSFSIGDSAEFLYGDQRDVDKADKVSLDSGDVLIFGGKSRNIFHGVASIVPDTAPKVLLEETDLRPGRLNLTFREY